MEVYAIGLVNEGYAVVNSSNSVRSVGISNHPQSLSCMYSLAGGSSHPGVIGCVFAPWKGFI
jgi:hypothetical protein